MARYSEVSVSDGATNAAWLAQLVERQSAVWEVEGGAPDQTNTQGLKITETQGLKITETNVLPL